jgi:hypothetical protein
VHLQDKYDDSSKGLNQIASISQGASVPENGRRRGKRAGRAWITQEHLLSPRISATAMIETIGVTGHSMSRPGSKTQICWCSSVIGNLLVENWTAWNWD